MLSAVLTAAVLLAACQSSPSSAPAQPGPETAAEAADETPPAAAAESGPNESETLAAAGAAPGETVPRATYETLPEQALELAAIDPIPRRVALLLPLSGADAPVGEAMLKAAQLALFDFADAGFELVVHDTRGTPEGAARAGRQAIFDGASLILGPLRASSVDQVAPSARAAGINMVAFSNDRFVAGDGVFVMGFLPGSQVDRVVAFAGSRGLTRFAALAPENAYGLEVVESLRLAVGAAGGSLTQVVYYDPRAEDLSEPVRRIARFETRQGALESQRQALLARGDEVAQRALARLDGAQTAGNLPYDALVLADSGQRLQSLAAHLPYYDVDPSAVRMLGSFDWGNAAGVSTEPALIGGWFAAPPPEARAEYQVRYRETYGESPLRLTTLAYDATALAAVLAASPGGPDYSFRALTSPSGFAGRDGIFRFGPDGLVERGLSVLQLEPRGHRVIDPAPSTFPSPGR